MSELRQNPITGNWTIIAPERALRLGSTSVKKIDDHNVECNSSCVFCNGNEHTTPEEVFSIKDDKNNWLLRVVANKYPAFDNKESFNLLTLDDFHIKGYAYGIAEVVIETSHHSNTMSLFTKDEIKNVILAYKERLTALCSDSSLKYVLIFKNNKKESGASISHSHSQIMGMPFIPPIVEKELENSLNYYNKTGKCIFCEMIENSLINKSEVVYENEQFISILPYASIYPYETWILPKCHTAKYNDINESQQIFLADAMKITLSKIYQVLQDPPFNYYIHTAPVNKNVDKYFHWHIELIPKLTISAGFELGSGVFINIADPAKCAEDLKKV